MSRFEMKLQKTNLKCLLETTYEFMSIYNSELQIHSNQNTGNSRHFQPACCVWNDSSSSKSSQGGRISGKRFRPSHSEVTRKIWVVQHYTIMNTMGTHNLHFYRGCIAHIFGVLKPFIIFIFHGHLGVQGSLYPYGSKVSPEKIQIASKLNHWVRSKHLDP